MRCRKHFWFSTQGSNSCSELPFPTCSKARNTQVQIGVQHNFISFEINNSLSQKNVHNWVVQNQKRSVKKSSFLVGKLAADVCHKRHDRSKGIVLPITATAKARKLEKAQTAVSFWFFCLLKNMWSTVRRGSASYSENQAPCNPILAGKKCPRTGIFLTKKSPGSNLVQELRWNTTENPPLPTATHSWPKHPISIISHTTLC